MVIFSPFFARESLRQPQRVGILPEFCFPCKSATSTNLCYADVRALMEEARPGILEKARTMGQ